MPVPEAARRHYLEQRALAAAITRAARQAWAQLDIRSLDQSWAANRIGDQLMVAAASGQTIAAGRADVYLDAVLAEQSIAIDRTGTISARSFAGVASDGRNLDTLLYEPVIATKVALSRGATADQALQAGEQSLARIVATQVQDAGRTAVVVATAARPAANRWTRMLSPPSCSRCAVLAGKVFHWEAGFDRHPLCDCIAIPSSENVAGDVTTDPAQYFRSLSTADQDRYFTKAGAESIRNGGDIGQVVNARRGMYQANAFTSEGTTRRGIAGKGLAGAQRLMPETIVQSASGDRNEIVRLLKLNGYLT